MTVQFPSQARAAPRPTIAATLGDMLRSVFGGREPAPSDLFAESLRALDARDAQVDRRMTRDLIAIQPHLQRFARSLVQDDVQAEDLVQDTLLRAWHARDRFIPGTSLRAWTYTILKRVHLSNGRRMKFVGTYDDALERSLSIDETQSMAVHMADVERAFAELSEEHRTALHLIAVEQLSYEEVAASTGLPVGTVKSRVARGRRMLITLLTADAASRRAARPAPAPVRMGGWPAATALQA